MRRAIWLALPSLVLMVVFVTPAAPHVAQRPPRRAAAAERIVVRAHPPCTITGTSHDDRLRGTDGPDVICAKRGDDRVRALGGDDVLVLGPGRDTFEAGPGDDRVLAGDGRDFGNGGTGNDRIILGRGDDVSEDWAGVDLLVGGRGDDSLCVYDWRTNAPRDRVRGGPGPDYVGANVGDIVRSVAIVFYGGCWD